MHATTGTEPTGTRGIDRVAPTAVTLDEIVSMKSVSQIALSPDGSTVAYVSSTASMEGEHPAGQIYLVDVDGPSEGWTRPFTSGSGRDEQPRWSPDGRSLAFVSDREAAGTMQLYTIALDGGEAQRLTTGRGAVTDPRWSPDGTGLAYLVTDAESEEGERRKKERDDAIVASEVFKRRRLWLRRLDGAEPTPLTPSDLHVWFYAWAPAGDRLAVVTSATPEFNETFRAVQLSIYRLDGSEPQQLGSAPAPHPDLVWSQDGTRLHLLGALAEDFPQLYLRTWTLDGSASHGPQLTLRDLPATLVALYRASDSEALTLLTWRDTHTPLYRVTPDGTQADLLPVPIAEQGSASDLSLSADGQRLAFVRSDGTHEGDVWVWDVARGMRQLTDVNPWLRERRLGTQEEIAWTSFDGEEIRGLLIKPPDYEPGRRYPLVVNVHGGPTWLWTDHLHLNWHDWGMWLALHGFLCLLPNPRGSAGRGNAFAHANVGDIGGGDHRDVLAGVDYLVAQGLADEQRLGIGGWSYGGTLTPWILTQTTRFRCAVMGAGICNWVSFSGTCDIRIFGDVLFDATLHRDATPLWERSALSRVDRVQTPTLIVHGADDPRVPVSQGREFYSALRHRGVPTEYVVYPREGHQFKERHHQRDLLARIGAWFTHYLLPTEEGAV